MNLFYDLQKNEEGCQNFRGKKNKKGLDGNFRNDSFYKIKFN